jgi:hypothetical protein
MGQRPFQKTNTEQKEECIRRINKKQEWKKDFTAIPPGRLVVFSFHRVVIVK